MSTLSAAKKRGLKDKHLEAEAAKKALALEMKDQVEKEKALKEKKN